MPVTNYQLTAFSHSGAMKKKYHNTWTQIILLLSHSQSVPLLQDPFFLFSGCLPFTFSVLSVYGSAWSLALLKCCWKPWDTISQPWWLFLLGFTQAGRLHTLQRDSNFTPAAKPPHMLSVVCMWDKDCPNKSQYVKRRMWKKQARHLF